jgi:hypothetical protein
MNSPNGDSAANRVRQWWLTPPRRGLQRLIYPWEYRHLRAFAAIRIVGGILAAIAGLICLSQGAPAWAAFFLVVAALALAAAYWYLTIARSASART